MNNSYKSIVILNGTGIFSIFGKIINFLLFNLPLGWCIRISPLSACRFGTRVKVGHQSPPAFELLQGL